MFHLIVRGDVIRPLTKIDQIRTVWEWSASPFPEDHWALREEVLTGVSHPGPAYNMHRWREFRFIVSAMTDWFGLSTEQRHSLLADSWGFAAWIYGRRLVEGRQFHRACLHLLFPDSFEPILTRSHKKAIVRAFAREWSEPAPDDENEISSDRALLKSRRRLEAEHPEEEVGFYRHPVGVSHDGRVDAHRAPPAGRRITGPPERPRLTLRLKRSAGGRPTESSRRRPGHHRQHWRYLSPEVLSGQPAEEADDVWSLCVVLHEFERRANEEGVDPMENRQGRGFQQAPHPLSFSMRKEQTPRNDQLNETVH